MVATMWWMLAGGLLLLTAGAEFLVRGASRLAALCGISPLVVGLTVVAYGTSMPELAVSVKAGLGGLDNIAVANVVGSNTFNVLFILGACALILPLKVSVQLVRWDVPIMIVASLLLMIMGLDHRLGWVDGVPLFGGIVWYTVWSIRKSRRETAAAQAEFAKAFGPRPTPGGRGRTMVLQVSIIVMGLVLLVVGARWLVNAAVAVAQALGVSETVIGLTVVAAGTSLPEVATSIVATIRGQRDIAIGNVVGSNIYNILAILGLCAMVTPGGLAVADTMVRFDIPVMVAVALSCLPIFFSGFTISRREGLVFLGTYASYVVWLILQAVEHPAFAAYSQVMLFIAAPLIGALLLIHRVRAYRRSSQGVQRGS
jgi:cation:H+ antiporter